MDSNLAKPLKDWSQAERDEFLTKKYHYLTSQIQPQDFFSYLIKKEVFTEEDKVEVETKYTNTWLQAGHMIDIIKSSKGQTGFLAIMEVIEYTDKEFFEELTGLKANPLPSGMDSNPVKPLKDWSQEERDEFLTKKYHYLTRRIQPQDFFSYLIEMSVFTEQDKKDVETKYNNRWLQAAHMIDIIKTSKGQAGFLAFMEVIEYTDEEVFEELTGLKPNPPPPGFQIPVSVYYRRNRNEESEYKRRRQLLLDPPDFGKDMIPDLCKSVMEKTTEIEQLNSFIEQIKKLLNIESQEKETIVEVLDSIRAENEQLVSKKGELESKLELMSKKSENHLEKINDMSKSIELLKAEKNEQKRISDQKIQSLEEEIQRLKAIHCSTTTPSPDKESIHPDPSSSINVQIKQNPETPKAISKPVPPKRKNLDRLNPI